MKQKLWLLPLLLAGLCMSLMPFAPASVRAQGAVSETNASALSAAPYRSGEKLSYNVAFSRFQSAAHVELFVNGRTTIGTRQAIELRAHVETLGVVNVALYSVNNDYVTYVDPATGLPFRTEQLIREGGARVPIDAARDFNQPADPSAQPARQTAGGFPGTYDFLSAIYRLRSLPLVQGASYRLSVQGTDELYDAELRVTGRELLKTNIGSFNAIATQVSVRRNPSANNYKIRLFFSDDERHIPVLITAQHPSGEVRVEIASAEFVEQTPPPASISTTPVNPLNTTPPVVLPGTTPPNPNTTRRNPPTPGGAPGGASAGETALPGLPFSVGEQLNFRFFLGDAVQPVGTAALQVRARAKYFNRDGLLLSALMGTTGAGQRLFPVSDQINSYVDATSLLPFRTELRIQEGRHRLNAVVNVDQDRGNAQFDDRTRLELPVGTHDIISVFYALRSFDLTPPRRNAVSLLINKRPRTLFVTALRREAIEIGGQRINATQLSLVTDDTQGDRLQLRLWVSTDRRRLPLRLTAVTPLGPVRADLAIIPVGLQ
ncbi:MAG TPA: DUF3108 domain-containing protein [Pyrinomonadaceae bacterium]|nr:DUF3108 domain-containing protein [Pyrinomonadaceae bacterium]